MMVAAYFLHSITEKIVKNDSCGAMARDTLGNSFFFNLAELKTCVD